MRPRWLIIRCHTCRKDTKAEKFMAVSAGGRSWVNVCLECGATHDAMAPGKQFRTARQKRVLEQLFGG